MPKGERPKGASRAVTAPSEKGEGGAVSPAAPVNLRTLANHLQLSQTTVSLVLNNSPSAKSIPEETRQRVLDAAKKLNYRPNYFARSLRQSRSMSVGVLAPDLSEGYFTRVMSGVVAELTAAHYFYFTACHDWNRELIAQYPRMLVERAVDGFLLLNTPADEIQVPVPVVAISAHSAAANVTNIVLDHESAVRQALKHLYELGHRNIAFMRGPKAIPDSEFRWESIQKVARGLGLKIDPAHVLRMDVDGWSIKKGHHPMAPEIGYRPMKALLEKSKDFTAVFCFNDIAAIGAIRALKDAGLSVPQDVSVVGFDDIQSAAYSTPSLTTVQQPATQIGIHAAELLLNRMAFPGRPARTVVLGTELIVRASALARPVDSGLPESQASAVGHP